MDYQSILRTAFDMVKKHRFLWLLGLLSGGSSPNWQFGQNSFSLDESELEKLRNLKDNIPINLPSTKLVLANTADSLGRVLGESVGSAAEQQFFWPITIMLLAFVALAVYLSTTAKNAIIKSVYMVDKGKSTTLRESWHIGHKYFWRQLSLSIIMTALVILPILLLVAPVVLLAIFEIITPAIVLGAVSAVVIIVFSIYVTLVVPYAQRILVLENKRPFESIVSGVKFFNRSWLQLLGLYFILLAINIAASIAFVLALLIAAGILFAIGAIINTLGSIAVAIYASIAVVALVIAIFAYGGIVNSFASASTTLAYLDRKNATKESS